MQFTHRRSRRDSLLPLLILVWLGPGALPAAELLAFWDFDDAGTPSTAVDHIASRAGVLQGGAAYTADAGGRSGATGDFAIDFGATSSGQTVLVSDASFLNDATSGDQITIAFWQKLAATGNSSTFWAVSPSSSGNQRGLQVHLPWSDGTIYYDSAGCCGGGQRATASPPAPFDWTDWHHFAVVKNGGTRELWIDGALVLNAGGAAPLPADFTSLYLGSEFGSNSLQGVLDEFAVFDTALEAGEIASLASGTSPLELVAPDPDLPAVEVLPASAVGTTTATLHGAVTATGIDAPAVTIFYGLADGGTDAAAWDAQVALPGTQTGGFSTALSALTPGVAYFFTARAVNSAGTRWAAETESFTTLPLAPAVDNLAATDVQAFAATIGATVLSTGGEDPEVTLFFGTSDGATTPGAWQNSVSLGTTSDGGTTTLSGLASGTTHFFRARATNAGGAAWAPATASFSTVVSQPAMIANAPADQITGSSARLNGTVLDDGSDPPAITIYYGTSDGGTNAATWESAVSDGIQSGDFSQRVTLLAPETTYYFRARGVNASGPSWAPATESFTTAVAAPLSIVINEIHHDADPKTERAEFVELVNAGDLTVDLSGWRIDGGIDYAFPSGTSLAPGSFLVVAEDPATMLAKFGVSTAHQYNRSLDNDGEEILLLDSGGAEVDRVDYRAGFPWPTAARGTGSSMELIHPALDNDLGGSWRSSSAGSLDPEVTYIAPGESWRYRKGTSEASTPIDAWRFGGFVEDASWQTGTAGFGYGDGDDATVLDDMAGSYSTVYLRKEFVVPAGEIPSRLLVRAYVDDGAIVWINGFEVARFSVTAGEKAYNAFATSHEAAWEEQLVSNAANVLVGGTNLIAVHGLNATLASSDFSLDLEVKTPDPGSAAGDPTPGAPNTVMTVSASSAPPAIRQVNHTPGQPGSNDDVLVTAKVTDPDGVQAVTLSYQLVDPGAYLRLDDPAYETTWTALPMTDDGTGGDLLAGDATFTSILPGTLHLHRRLVRYRIEVEDALGNRARVPYADDESPNFAYFVYDRVPAWSAAEQPGVTPVRTVPAPVMNDALPVYHLLANATDVVNSQYNSGSDGVRMRGTLVYDGVVYDHIEFYNRGEASTYVSGKNKWRFKFNRARDFEARDIYGRKYDLPWKTMNFNACASPWVDTNRGIAGLDEAVPHRLYQLAGVVGSNTHWVHFRVVDETSEAPADQYAGDLWGLYLAIEHPDGRFLAEHGLPDGNVYKIQGGGGDKKNQGPTQPESSSDWSSFYSASGSLNTVAWWRSNFDLPSYYGFRAINRATGNVDLREHTNYYMYHHPDGRWHVIPWDLDMMYAPVKHVWSGVIQAQACLGHSVISIEFKNRCRELLDLLFSDLGRHGGQAAQVVEELSQIVNPAGVPLTMVDADQFMWSHHPRTRGEHRGPWYLLSKTETTLQTSYVRTIPTPDHEGFQQSIIDYMHDTRPGGGFAVNDRIEDGYGFGYLSQEAADSQIPATPAISYVGAAGFPANGVRFQSGAFNDPQGVATFTALEWRLGEIRNPSTPNYVAGEPWVYEVETVWKSPEIFPFESEIGIPTAVLRPGHTYRARVRHKDTTGRWSHWSALVEFLAAAPSVTAWQQGLVISEIMYNPTGGPDHEFLELLNVGSTTLDLTDVRFTKGIDFDFPAGAMITPGEYLLVVANQAAFEARYGPGLPVAGEWEAGDRLDNSGENLKLSLGAGTPIHEFDYGTAPPWPSTPDSHGYSLTLACPVPGVDHGDPANWRASAAVGGSPGTSDREPLDAWLANHGLSPAQLLTDLDLDGLSALLEYALGTNPGGFDEGTTIAGGLRTLLVGSASDDYLVIEFPRRKAADDVVIEAEYSTDLVTWQPAGPVLAFTPTADPAIEMIAIRAPAPASSEPRQFLRLRVTQK